MPIYNKRFILKLKKDITLLDGVINWFRENLKGSQFPLRYAIVGVRGRKIIIDATVED